MDESQIVEVYSALDSCEAHLLRNWLESNSIDARVVSDILRVAGGELPLGQSTAPRIWVHKRDEQRARQLVAEWQAGRHGGESQAELLGWICPSCGHEVDGNFDVCWNCECLREANQS